MVASSQPVNLTLIVGTNGKRCDSRTNTAVEKQQGPVTLAAATATICYENKKYYRQWSKECSVTDGRTPYERR